jgi:hypothetical protein
MFVKELTETHKYTTWGNANFGNVKARCTYNNHNRRKSSPTQQLFIPVLIQQHILA